METDNPATKSSELADLVKELCFIGHLLHHWPKATRDKHTETIDRLKTRQTELRKTLGL